MPGRAQRWDRETIARLVATAVVACLWPISRSPAAELPVHAPRPGGVVTVALPPHPTAGLASPRARHAGKPVPVVMHDGRWYAIVGVPLSRSPGPLTIERVEPQPSVELTVSIEAHAYREQRLEVSRRYVEPSAEQLKRIRRERSELDAALERFSAGQPESYRFAAPVPGRQSPSFGFRRIFNDQPRSPHSGMDISASLGTPVQAPLGGTVALTGNFYFNGNTVMLDHGQGFVTAYLHLDRIDVAPGQRVAAGDPLGTVGATGRVTGAHLHFGTYLNGTAVDPGLFLTRADEPSARREQR